MEPVMQCPTKPLQVIDSLGPFGTVWRFEKRENLLSNPIQLGSSNHLRPPIIESASWTRGRIMKSSHISRVLFCALFLVLISTFSLVGCQGLVPSSNTGSFALVVT